MKEKQTSENESAQAREIRRLIFGSSVVMAVLVALLLIYRQHRPALLSALAQNAAENGRYGRAAAVLSRLESTPERDALLQEYDYQIALGMFAAGDYEGAKQIFRRLGEYRDSRGQVLACRYEQAMDVYESGDYETARSLFSELGGYREAVGMYDACRYRLATLQAGQGDDFAAMKAFAELGGYEDSRARAGEIAVRLTGIADVQTALTAALGYTGEELRQRAALAALRDALPKQALAIGFYHTVGLCADGTALAAGGNEYGQCDVSGWSDVKAVDAGAYHTVGLRADGTVVAAGSNEQGQCDVSGWSGVVAIACSDYNTIALLGDGSVVSTGFQEYAGLGGWRDIVAIGAGSYIALGVRGNGQMLASHPSARDDSFSDLVAADANTGYAVCLRADGAVLSTFLELGEWKNMTAVAASATGMFGLTAEGRVLSRWFRAGDEIGLPDIAGAVALAAGATHIAVLLDDGTVIARGNNEFGQCDTAAWNLGANRVYGAGEAPGD